MRALLRADWVRFRRRRDLWIMGIAVLVLSGVTFLAAWHSDATDPSWPDAAQIRDEVRSYTEFGGMTQAEIDAQIEVMVVDQVAMYDSQRAEWEAQQAVALQKYDLPQAPFTMVGSGWAPLLALVLIASLAVGDEFRFGTIRTSLLAAGNRRRFLAARLTSLVAMTVALFGALVLLGVLLAAILRLSGAEVVATTTPIDVVAAIAWLVGLVLVTVVVVALATALTLVLRSGALPLLLIIIAGLIELFVSALPIFQPGEFLAGVPQAFLTTSIRALTAQLGLDTHAVALAGAETPWAAISVPPVGVAAIVAAWGLLFVLAADRRLRSMDVVE